MKELELKYSFRVLLGRRDEFRKQTWWQPRRRLQRGCQSRPCRNPPNPEPPQGPRTEMARQEDQVTPKAGLEAVPRRCQTGKGNASRVLSILIKKLC